MLKLRKRHQPAMTTDARTGDLEIRNLLDDPQLRALMGDAAGIAVVTPIRLEWTRSEPAVRPWLGRRLMQRAA